MAFFFPLNSVVVSLHAPPSSIKPPASPNSLSLSCRNVSPGSVRLAWKAVSPALWGSWASFVTHQIRRYRSQGQEFFAL